MIRANVPVDSYDQVVDNVKRFNEAVDADHPITDRLSLFRHWYYIPELDMFGPSKFVGYKDMDADFYLTGHGIPGVRASKDGGVTEEVLSTWFDQLNDDAPRWFELEGKLRSWFPRAKLPRSPHYIHVPKGWWQSMDSTIIVDRFEDDVAVIEYQGRMFSFPRALLPANTKEGDILKIAVGVDEPATVLRRDTVKSLEDRLFKK